MDWVLINNLIYMNKTSNRLSEWDSQKNAALEVCFNCMTCGRVYRSKTALSLHVRVECGKEPVSYTHLDVYKRQHSFFFKAMNCILVNVSMNYVISEI